MTLPNAISLARLILVPVFAWLQLAERPLAALIVFVVAAISDGLDGLLARLLDQRTALGAILDPLADKLLGFTALLLLALGGQLPFWFFGASMLRDAVVFGVSISTRIAHLRLHAAPTRISKYATFLVMATVTLALLADSPRFGAPLRPWLASVGAVAAQCLLVATVQYALLWRSLLVRRGEVARG